MLRDRERALDTRRLKRSSRERFPAPVLPLVLQIKEKPSRPKRQEERSRENTSDGQTGS